MAHDDELILPPRLLEIGHPAALLNDLYDLFVFFVGKHVCNLHIRFDGRQRTRTGHPPVSAVLFSRDAALSAAVFS